jgi:GT2 family glycosyltransferase
VVFLNNDTVVDSEWLIEAIKILEKDNSIGAAQPKLLLIRNHKIIDSVGDFIDKYGFSFMKGCGKKDVGQYDNVEEIFSARGACLITRKSLFRKVGGFDSDFFLSYEDIDYCWRVRLLGYKIILVPFSIVYHIGAATKFVKKILIFHSIKNRFLLIIKNYSTKNALKYFLIRLIIDIRRAIILQKHDSRIFGITLSSIYWILKNFKKLWRKHLFTQQYLRKIKDIEIMNKMMKPIIPFPLLLLPYLRSKYKKRRINK